MPKVTNTKRLSEIKNSNKIDMPLLITVLMLLALGIVMVLSASAPSALADYGDSYRYAFKQGTAAIGGIVAMVFMAKFFSYKRFRNSYVLIYILSILILFLVLIPGLGQEINGAKRWIRIAGLQIQPSEATKIGLIIFYAGYFTDKKIPHTKFVWGTLIPIVALALPVFILLKVQNHMSAGVVMAIVTVVVIFMSGVQLKHYLELLGLGAVGILLAFPFLKDKIIGGFRSERITAWLNPEADPTGTAYQTLQGLYAIGSGGLFGVGLGQSKQKYMYIPEAHNDFIFAILAEELGFVGCAIILILFAVFTIRGILISIRAEDMFGSLIALGITTLIAVQAVLNIAVVTNTVPNTGISLPFLSYGGTSLVILLAGVGILLNISKSAKKI